MTPASGCYCGSRKRYFHTNPSGGRAGDHGATKQPRVVDDRITSNQEMKPTIKPRVKICCMASVEEAWMAIDAGASAVGLVSAMPSGPGPIPEGLIAESAATILPGVSSFLLTCF